MEITPDKPSKSQLEFGFASDCDKDTCISLVVDAFENYPYFTMYIPDASKRRRFIENSIKVDYSLSWNHQSALVAKRDGKILGLATLRSPGFKRPGVASYFRAGFWRGALHAGLGPFLSWISMEEKAGQPCHDQAAGAWYLDTLSIAPDCHSQGIGTRMLQEHVIPYVKQQGGSTLCLYTNAEKNRAFYTKNGFREFDEMRFEYKGRSMGSWSYLMDL